MLPQYEMIMVEVCVLFGLRKMPSTATCPTTLAVFRSSVHGYTVYKTRNVFREKVVARVDCVMAMSKLSDKLMDR